jgi:hypothetical protein
MSVEQLVIFEDSMLKKSILHEILYICSKHFVQRTKFIFEKINSFTTNIIFLRAAKVTMACQ